MLDAAVVRSVDTLEPGHAVTAEDLEECCQWQGVSVESGDVVLVHTGNARFWREPERYLAGSGVAVSVSYWLAERQVLAVGADNMAWDVPAVKDSDPGCTLPRHLILLVRYGIYIIENLRREELAAALEISASVLPARCSSSSGPRVRPSGQ